VPYVLLALPTAISLTAPGQDASRRLTTALLAALAAGWLWLTHTRPHLTWVDAAGRRPPLRVALPHFVGLLVLGAVLTLHDLVFVLFLITGFFHASCCRRRWPWSACC
jgi:hypothetical protein